MNKKAMEAKRKPEDKIPKAWRQQCMMELELSAARSRVLAPVWPRPDPR
jgi:hypothetical protein